jgi:hypothetical protein
MAQRIAASAAASRRTPFLCPDFPQDHQRTRNACLILRRGVSQGLQTHDRALLCRGISGQ